jgi:hypothetical protein
VLNQSVGGEVSVLNTNTHTGTLFAALMRHFIHTHTPIYYRRVQIITAVQVVVTEQRTDMRWFIAFGGACFEVRIEVGCCHTRGSNTIV